MTEQDDIPTLIVDPDGRATLLQAECDPETCIDPECRLRHEAIRVIEKEKR